MFDEEYTEMIRILMKKYPKFYQVSDTHWTLDHPDNTLLQTEDIKGLIDIALQSKDQAWFMELTHRLAVME